MALGQLARVRRDKRLAPNQLAALNERLKMLPDIIAQRQEREIMDQQERQARKQRQLVKDQMAQQEKEEKAALGLKAATAGGQLLLGGGSAGKLGSKTFGDVAGSIGGKVKSMFGGAHTPVKYEAGYTGPGMTKSTGPWGAIKGAAGRQTLGSTLGAGLVGFGAGQLLGGDKPWKRALFGAGAGLLSNLFTGAGGGGWGGLASGGLFGGLGGALGGLL